ncbi:MAG: ribonuclease D, partial [Acidimicrobiales bacterium]
MARSRPPRRHWVGGGLISRPGAAGHEWIETTTGLADLVDRLAGEPAIGLDTEFHRERTYFPKVALVQLAWPAGVALVDAVAVDMASLAPLLHRTTVVMHAAAQDLEVLAHAAGVVPPTLFDTQLAACFAGYGNPSLGSLIAGELGIKVAKGDRLADWLRRPLHKGQ